MKPKFIPTPSKPKDSQELIATLENPDLFSDLVSPVEQKKFKETLARQLKCISSKYATLFWKAALGKASPRQAIKAKCQNCVGYSNTTDEIKNCQSYNCPLWPYRPFKI